MCTRVLVILVALLGSSVASENPDFTHGLQILSKITRQFLHSQTEDVKIGEGVHLINTVSPNDARANMDDGTFIGAVENYLKSHEIRIKLPELMPEEGVGRAFKVVMDGFDSNEIGSPRAKGGLGGGKGGGLGGVMLMGLMMGKMMAALGLGGVGLLAMKALMVSAMALMLSMIVGLKKLVSSDHDDSGGHTVIHASPSHGGGYEHRKKREAAEMAYKAWSSYSQS